MKTLPNLFHYDDYRQYLKDWYEFKKAKEAYTYRKFSEEAGFRSPNQLQLVFQGKRNITEETLNNYLKILNLKISERKYFSLLVDFNQSKDPGEKKKVLKEIDALRKRKGFLERAKQDQYITNWYYTAIFEMVHLKDFQEDGEWIAKKLGSLITAAKANEALKDLLDLKLLERNAEGRLVQTQEYVSTGSETQSLAAYLYHEQMIKLTLDTLEKGNAEKRNLTALTFSLREKDYEEIVQEIHKFRSKLIGFLNHRLNQYEDERLYQFNLHLFPLSVDTE